MSEVLKPGKKDVVSVRHLPATKQDREELNKAFREQKAIEKKHKDERFAKIAERRKNRPSDGKGGRGINIEVTSDK